MIGNIQLITIYIIVVIESILAFITYNRIDINADKLLRRNKSSLFEVIMIEFKTVLSLIFSILLLTIPFYFDNNIPIWLYLLIYFLILYIYFKLEWINKKLNNE